MKFSPKTLTLVIDQGTHATRAVAVDSCGKIRASAFVNVALKRHGPDTVEQDAEEIVASARAVMNRILSDRTVKRMGVGSAGIATQRSSIVAWDRKNGKPLAPLISWQDFRNAKWLKTLEPHAGRIKHLTGLRLTPHYGASKFRWYMDNVPEIARAKEKNRLVMGPLASFLLFNLVKGRPFLADHVNASRTQLLNIKTLKWDPWLLDLFGIPMDMLPEPCPVCYNYGILNDADIRVTAVNGDQNSAIYNLGQPTPHHAMMNIGTGAFVLLPTGHDIVQERDLLSGISCSRVDGYEYILEGTVNGAGASLDWAAEKWKLKDAFKKLPAWMKEKKDVPIFINTIGGLGSPWWRSGPEAKIIGHGEASQNMVAVVESIVFMLNANLERMEKAGLHIRNIQAGGGLSRIDAICQRIADLTRRTVYRPAETESTARGMAWLASGCPKKWPKPGRGKYFVPQLNPYIKKRYIKFLTAIG